MSTFSLNFQKFFICTQKKPKFWSEKNILRKFYHFITILLQICHLFLFFQKWIDFFLFSQNSNKKVFKFKIMQFANKRKKNREVSYDCPSIMKYGGK